MKQLCEFNDQNLLGSDAYSQKSPRIAARGIVHNREGMYAVLYMAKYDVYCLPGGGVEPNEELLTALHREILEETGCLCDEIQPIGMIYENRGSVDFTQKSYYYSILANHDTLMPQYTAEECDRMTELQWHPFDTLVHLIKAPVHTQSNRIFYQARDIAALQEYERRNKFFENILASMGISAKDVLFITQYNREEDDSAYNVWKILLKDATYVLKESTQQEAEIYNAYLQNNSGASPKLIASCNVENKVYLLLEYIAGMNLQKSSRAALTLALDALITLQEKYWNADSDAFYQASLQSRTERGKFLDDSEIEAAYRRYLQKFSSLPRTLCHDDLLPFNVLSSEDRATLIDWEHAGILPYPTSLARLIAHTEEAEDAFFYMSQEDKAFAVDYYYDKLLKGKGIAYNEYRSALDDFLLYEYCEWIMLGVKYDNRGTRYHQYLEKARQLIRSRE